MLLVRNSQKHLLEVRKERPSLQQFVMRGKPNCRGSLSPPR